jgi:hypothetical protein
MSDIKLFRPQRLTDNPDGGGLATGTEVVDGEVNNLFDDISRIDRVNGELSLRKVFAIAATDDTELFADLHMIVQAPPLDPRVSSVIFRTNAGWGDERDDAKNYVERYLDPSVITRMIPYDRQLQGQRTVLVYQRPELALPEIGEVYVLVNDLTGAAEYFRVQDLDHEVQTFTDDRGDYTARIITLTISQPLSGEFAGSQPNRFFTADPNASLVRRTIASDAARFKGVVRLAQDAPAGSLTVKVESIFAQLVPAATSEVAVLDAPPAGVVALVPAAEEVFSVSNTSLRHWVFPTSVTPGSVVAWSAGRDRIIATDNGAGLLVLPSGARFGSVDYLRGSATLDTVPGTMSIDYLPAAGVAKAPHSDSTPVTLSNRGYVYPKTLRPPPARGTLSVSFRAQGRWYTLQDDGSGALRGDAGVGVGSVNFQTGTASATLGALPDIGSAVIWAWGTASEYEVVAGEVAVEPPTFRFTLDAGNAEPGTLQWTWTAGGVIRAAAADDAGQISGDAVGRVQHATGEVILQPAVLPDSGTIFRAEYEAGTTTTEVFTPGASGGSIVLELSDLPRPGSLQLAIPVFGEGPYGATLGTTVRLFDDGAGGVLDANGEHVQGALVAYATGVVSVPTTYIRAGSEMVRSDYAGTLPSRVAGVDTHAFGLLNERVRKIVGSVATTVLAGFINGSAITATYKRAAEVNATRNEDHRADALQIDLTPNRSARIVGGAVVFTFQGRTYFDRAGVLYATSQPSESDKATVAGRIDFATGVASLSSWQGGAAVGPLVLRSLLAEVAPIPVYVVNGRTPGAPLRPGTFSIRAVRARDSAEVSATADNNGNLVAAGVHGVVDSVHGVYVVGFGAWVADSSLTAEDRAEPWYSPDLVGEDGYIWRPDEVLPESVRINAVVQVALPIDPEIIKVNPVRLPMDGRVPVVRPGDTLVLHDPQPYTLPTLVAGGTVTLPRDGLSSVAVYDQEGLGVPLAVLGEFDLEAGTLEVSPTLDLEGYSLPLVAIHSVEDMALCLDAQITGEVALAQPTTRDYSAGNSLLSTALILGDAQARYEHLFAQNTWTGVWSDSRIGDPPTGGAQYNDALWPLVLANRHAITQRWRLHFTSPTSFNVIGEELGVVGTGNTSEGASPLNPATGEPYVVVPPLGFGGGWASGNNLRFNTVAAGAPVWVARTVLSGPATQVDDRIRLQTRWDKD